MNFLLLIFYQTSGSKRARIQTTATFGLVNLENFVSEKSGKRCEKSGRYWIKSENREILRRFIFFLYPRLHSPLPGWFSIHFIMTCNISKCYTSPHWSFWKSTFYFQFMAYHEISSISIDTRTPLNRRLSLM